MDRHKDDCKVTVIVPVYNKDRYIVRCLNSLKDQSIKEIEIICVDDGSTDFSNDKVRECMKRDARIRLLENKENKGTAYSRNLAMNSARGQYIFFLDADDYVDQFTLEHYYRELCDADAEMCFYNFIVQREGEHRTNCDEGIRGSYCGVYKGQKLLGCFAQNDEFFLYACMVAYKREFIDQNNLKFSNLRCGEGGLFILGALLVANRVIVSGFRGYHYCLNDDSVNASENIADEALYGQVVQYSYVLKQAAQKTETTGIYNFLKWYKNKFSGAVSNLSNEMIEQFGRRIDDDFLQHIWSVLTHTEKGQEELFSEGDLLLLKKENSVLLYGAGRETLDVLKLLNRFQIELKGIIVTEKKGNPKVLYGHKVVDADALYEYDKNTLVVITAHIKHHETITTALDKKGFYRYISIRRR